MKIIQVIEEYCNCHVLSAVIRSFDEAKVIYISNNNSNIDLTKTKSTTVNDGHTTLDISSIAKDGTTEYHIELMNKLMLCIIESQASWEIQDIFSRFNAISNEDVSLTDHIDQTLTTLVKSGLFKKVAILFYNERRSELRGVHIASTQEYSDKDIALFRTLRLDIAPDVLEKLCSDKHTYFSALDNALDVANSTDIVDNQLIMPLTAGTKIYGMLVTYSDDSYSEHHLSAAKSTAHLVSSMLSATIVYYKYKLAVTSEKQMSNKLREYEDMAFLGNNTASIAHEIKNPLIAIGGFAKRLMKAISDPNLQKMAMVISSESERLERLTADILSYSKKHLPHKEMINLFEELEATKLLFATRSVEANIKINVDIDSNLNIAVDAGQFRQVIVNLIANAMNAIEENGVVTINVNKDDDYTYINISDTGCGIKDEHIEHIFTPFFTTSNSGTGLGLAISKKIMINHGGDIHVDNTDDGAIITLKIPNN